MNNVYELIKTSARRRRRKKETWKTKFASAVSTKITDWDIGGKISRGIAKSLMKKGV